MGGAKHVYKPVVDNALVYALPCVARTYAQARSQNIVRRGTAYMWKGMHANEGDITIAC